MKLKEKRLGVQQSRVSRNDTDSKAAWEPAISAKSPSGERKRVEQEDEEKRGRWIVSHSGSEKYYSRFACVTIYVCAHICRLFIVVDVVDISGQAKVCDLHNVALCDQDVPGCKVSVYTLGQKGTTGETVKITTLKTF